MHGLSEPLDGWAPPERTYLGVLIGLGRHLLRRAADVVSDARKHADRGSDRGIGTTPTCSERPEVGRVLLIGAGPGDPELLTLKALRGLASADVILHDQLVSDEVLALAPRRARRIGVGKKGYGRSCRQDDINQLMVAHALAGRRVVRLKAGDPLVFARLEEEIAALEGAGIDFEIVPGISAAQGAASRLKVPLTGRRRSRRFQAITGHAAGGRLPHDFDWAGLADPKATTAVYMPKATIAELCAELMRRGLAPDLPAAAVFNATRANEIVIAATVATLPARIASVAGDAPCIVLIGAIVAQRAGASLASVRDQSVLDRVA